MKPALQDNTMRPLPLADEASAPFWAGANAGRLDIQRCQSCQRWNYAPTLACQSCGSFDLGFETVSGKATLTAWTIIKEAPAPGFRNMLPLIVGLVELVEQEQLLMAANILNAREQDLKLGLPLEVVFEKVSDDCTLPQFRPANS